MGVSVRRLAASFCGEVAGVDLNRLDKADIAAITAAWLAHKVLVFRDPFPDHFPRLMRRVGIAFPAESRTPF